MEQFSKHVGLEPATDLQRHLKALCQEAGLEVLDAKMVLQRKDTMAESFRVVFVWVREPGWERQVPEGLEDTVFAQLKQHQAEVHAFVPVGGEWPETAFVRCMAADRVAENGPTLRTGASKLADLPQFLREVLRQQKMIIAARQRGDKGPWDVGGLHWEIFEGGNV